MIIECPVSLGEVVDKMTILELKEEFIDDKEKLVHVMNEHRLLSEKIAELLKNNDLMELKHSLYEINKKLWIIEDNIRLKEIKQEFDGEFIELARSVYVTNDLRFRQKDKINKTFGSNIREVKSYKG
jgi:hypothetical protein